jgi:outer membrane protein, heavy metal efflux system
VIARVIVVAAVLRATIAAAQPPVDVTVDQAIALFREQSPRLAAIRAAIFVADADLLDARIYPNPTISISAAHTTIGGDTMGVTQPTLGIEVPLLVGRQRAHRLTAAEGHGKVARADAASSQGQAELDIHSRFVALLVAQEKTVVLTAGLADTKALREIVVGRSSAGASSMYAVERIDLAIATLASKVDDATADQASAAGDLAVAVGIPGWQPHAIGTLTPVTTGAAIDVAHPMLVLDQAKVSSSNADAIRAKADGVPTPSLAIQTWGTTDPRGLVLSAGFSVPLPFFDRNQGAVARARAEGRRAELELSAHKNQLATDLERALRVLAARSAARDRFQADGLQRLTKLRTMAEASYRAGQGGIVELLDALGAITEARLRNLELVAAVVVAALDVRRISSGR